METPTLTLLNTSFITPAAPTPPHLLYLSPLDTFWIRMHYNRRLLFYSLPPADCSAFVDRLKHSLSQTLLHFFPWAGRLLPNHENGEKLAVDCNDLGVEFVEASIDLPFTHLEDDGFQMKPFFHILTRHGDYSPEKASQLPLLSIQVTQFSNGGIALGVSQSHVIADGHSLWHFMNSWAERGRGLPISMPPLHDRTVFKIENPSREIASRFAIDKRLNEEIREKEDERKEEQQPKEEDERKGERQPKEMTEKLFHFSKAMMQKLKEKAFEEGGRTTRYTSYEVLSAHFWRHVTKARKLEEQTRVHFAVLVNFRSRLAKPLPASYFGNVLLFQMASGKAGELLREGFVATVKRIHETVVGCTENDLWGTIHFWELNDKSMVQNVEGAFIGEGMMIASSPRFPVYEVDFGWGRPKAVRSSKVEGDGEMVVFPGREEEGSIDICMSLTPESMERLQKDTDFIFKVV